jgi:phosphoribosylformimino-5-aminoimidazole carboxamide ribotide isomerase
MGNLLVIPSIDIKDGKTVRSVRGIPELNCDEYGDDPVEMAKIWRAENAKCLHIVDFDAAHEHSKQNFGIIKEICSSVIIPIEFTGGIRKIEDAAEIMELGVARIAINTMAIEDREEFKKVFEKYGPKKIIIALDIVGDQIITCGRSRLSGISPFEFTREMKEFGVERFVVTDIERNGMMTGPNLTLSRKIAEISKAKVTLSGGVRNKDELMDIKTLLPFGVDSVIIGRVLYENRFPCQKLWRIAENGIFN